ncbi:hypothetical protein EWM64_g3057 [Hericium alpestre]|uniref:FAD-binding domain-containing protein n=1 Tax=Hericium alpestre TaxID=135208 RepID=A0A4Z0A3Q3_9AGAM|nr:hypothetical protein EWM64_g3057 [Hericium alpestre]
MVEGPAAHSGLQKDLRVAIVGGGICGLVCAIGLVRAGLQYPAREDDLGLGIHRASFLDALVKFIDPRVTPTHFNKRCTDISVSGAERSPIVLHFSDGTTHETDFVIGADGIKSSVRDFVVHGSSTPYVPTFTNTVAYRGLVSIEELMRAGVKSQLTPTPICWMGDSRHIITFPIRKQQTLNVVAFVTDFSLPMGHLSLPLEEPWVVPASKDELLSQFSDWGDDARMVLQFIENPTKWSLHGLYPPLPSFVTGRVALIGDAAHAMLPHLGAGAGQGIEDSYVITRLLAHPQANATNLEVRVPAGPNLPPLLYL